MSSFPSSFAPPIIPTAVPPPPPKKPVPDWLKSNFRLGKVFNRGEARGRTYYVDTKQTKALLLTPSMAQDLYDYFNYEHQRRVNSKWVSYLSENMKGSTIDLTFDENGRPVLVNGQHTLRAIIESGVALEVGITVWQCEDKKAIDECYLHFDNHRPRSAQEGLEAAQKSGLLSMKHNPFMLKSIQSAIIMAENNYFSGGRIANSERVALLQDPLVAEFVDFISNLYQPKEKIWKVGILCSFYCIWKSDESPNRAMAKDFISLYRSLVNLPEGSPIVLLRNQLGSIADQNSVYEYVLYAYPAWMRFKNGQLCKALKKVKKGSLPAPDAW